MQFKGEKKRGEQHRESLQRSFLSLLFAGSSSCPTEEQQRRRWVKHTAKYKNEKEDKGRRKKEEEATRQLEVTPVPPRTSQATKKR
jgi:hypothetical protein